MPVTSHDIQLLATLARYYVLTREQLQRICFPEHASGRTTRKRLCKLQRGGFLQKHRMPVAFPGTASAAPVYYLTRKGAELLASWFDDAAYLATNTRQPRGDRLNHWIATNETRLTIEAAIARQSAVGLARFINEWETCNKDDAAKLHFSLHTQLSEQPPLSCSPDAGFLLTLGDTSKVYYLEQDLGTSSPKQIAARKTKGYEGLGEYPGASPAFPRHHARPVRRAVRDDQPLPMPRDGQTGRQAAAAGFVAVHRPARFDARDVPARGHHLEPQVGSRPAD